MAVEHAEQSWYNRSMKVKTSVTLSEELLHAIETEVKTENRSAFIERAVWDHLKALRREARDRKELDAIDSYAENLNSEALDVLDYQDRA